MLKLREQGEGTLRRLRKQPLGGYRYVRMRWRVLFAIVDFFGGLVAAIATGTYRLLSRGHRSDESSDTSDPNRILIVQLDHFGDAVITTAMLPALKGRFPDASIEVLAGPWNREVFEASPEVSCVHVSGANRFARGKLWRFAWPLSTLWWGLRLRRRQFDLAIDVRGEFPAAVLLWLCGATRRLGWASGGGGFLLTDSPEFVSDRPEIASRAALLFELGIDAGEIRPTFLPSEAAYRKVQKKLLNSQLSRRGRLVIAHVGAGTAAKQWPLEHWQALLGRLIVEHGVEVLLVGGESDAQLASRLFEGGVWSGAVDWTGQLSIDELGAVLQHADAFVGSDSGPAHLAAAVDTPAVVLFSGTNRAEQWKPHGDHVTVLRSDVDCSPCHRVRCPRAGHPCMQGISVDRVLGVLTQCRQSAQQELLGKPTEPSQTSSFVKLS